MAVTAEFQLIKLLKSDFSSVRSFILFGEDLYLLDFHSKKISSKSFDGDPFFNFQKFSGEINLSDVANAVEQMPMMADKKCIFIDDFDFEHCAKSDFDSLCAILEDIPDYCTVILRFETVECDIKRSAKFKKLVSCAEKGKGIAVNLEHRRAAELAKMLCDGAKKRGCELDRPTAEYAVEVIGDDISTLENELNKLCFYKENGKIEKADIDVACTRSVEASVYDYVSCIFAGNASKALKKLDDMFYLHTEPMIILYTAASSFVDMFRLNSAYKVKKGKNEVASDFSYKNKAFLLDKAAANLRKYDSRKLSLSLNELIKTDSALKSFGADPKLVLEEMTLKLIYIAVKGE